MPCGTTGENPTLTAAERLRIVEIVVDEANGQVPVLAGAGGYDTKEVIHLAGEMRRRGASGLLSVTPYYNKPTQEGLYQHYRAIAESTPLPIIVYNVPGRTGVQRRGRRRSRGWRRFRTSSASRKRPGNMHADVRDLPRGAARLPRAVGRRCADAAADGGRRTRHHLGGVERDSGGDGRRWSRRPSATTSPPRARFTRASCR